MLKHPLPGATRRTLGFGLVALLVAGSTYVAWASQPADSSPPITLARAGTAQGVTQPAPANATSNEMQRATYRLLRRIAYPPAQLAAKTQGVVYVKLRVGTDGTPASVAVDRVDPASANTLEDAAVAGVRSWRFNPARRDGKPVASDEIVPIVFSLHPDASMPVAGGTLDAIRVAPPGEPGAASVDRPPSEDVTYRNMHPPKYPEQAVRDKVTGKLQFKVLVDEHGVPQSVDVAQSDPPEAAQVLAQASIEAIMQWRFNPALKNGKPRSGYILVPIAFSLDDE